ncbi:hypothetical protein B0H15DRAFT_945000 [Mycena belliarum]|uniref:Uncharacterized protein n=1 Tax=Mycena belliarum TaxID=1033014 RepID=A0AAD6XZ37_9AGAR|nr:hypothetical protein B0H15DRAFT_945000 [Mycena belliae]
MVAAPAHKNQQRFWQREQAAAARRTRCQTRTPPMRRVPTPTLCAMRPQPRLLDERASPRTLAAAASRTEMRCAHRRLRANTTQPPLAPPLSWDAAQLAPSHSTAVLESVRAAASPTPPQGPAACPTFKVARRHNRGMRGMRRRRLPLHRSTLKSVRAASAKTRPGPCSRSPGAQPPFGHGAQAPAAPPDVRVCACRRHAYTARLAFEEPRPLAVQTSAVPPNARVAFRGVARARVRLDLCTEEPKCARTASGELRNDYHFVQRADGLRLPLPSPFGLP